MILLPSLGKRGDQISCLRLSLSHSFNQLLSPYTCQALAQVMGGSQVLRQMLFTHKVLSSFSRRGISGIWTEWFVVGRKVPPFAECLSLNCNRSHQSLRWMGRLMPKWEPSQLFRAADMKSYSWVWFLFHPFVSRGSQTRDNALCFSFPPCKMVATTAYTL